MMGIARTGDDIMRAIASAPNRGLSEYALLFSPVVNVRPHRTLYQGVMGGHVCQRRSGRRGTLACEFRYRFSDRRAQDQRRLFLMTVHRPRPNEIVRPWHIHVQKRAEIPTKGFMRSAERVTPKLTPPSNWTFLASL